MKHVLIPAILIVLFVILLLPLLELILMSFAWSAPWPNVLSDSPALDAWRYLGAPTSSTFEAVWQSVSIALAVTAVSLLLALPAADALGRRTFYGKRWLALLFYTPIVVPVFVALMGLQLAFIKWQLTDQWLGVLLAHLPLTLPYMIYALSISYRTLDFAWEDQARTLGAGRFSRFVYVVLPQLTPGLVTGCSLSILVSLSQYLITLLIGGGTVMTLPLLMFPFANGGEPTIGAAYVLLFAFVAGVLLLTTSFLIRWVTSIISR